MHKCYELGLCSGAWIIVLTVRNLMSVPGDRNSSMDAVMREKATACPLRLLIATICVACAGEIWHVLESGERHFGSWKEGGVPGSVCAREVPGPIANCVQGLWAGGSWEEGGDTQHRECPKVRGSRQGRCAPVSARRDGRLARGDLGTSIFWGLVEQQPLEHSAQNVRRGFFWVM